MMYSLNMCASLLVMMMVTTIMLDGSLVSCNYIFLRASNLTSATHLHPQAVRFQNVLEDPFNSYYEQDGEFFFVKIVCRIFLVE